MKIRMCRFLSVFLLVCLVSLHAGEQWQKIATPNVTIYTTSSVEAAREWAVGIEGLRSSLHEWFQTGEQPLEPLIIVVFGSDATYARFVGGQKGQSRDRLLDTSRATLANGRFMVALNGGYRDSLQRSVFTQSSLWLSGAFRRPLPLWLITGLQSVYYDFSLEKDRMVIGRKDFDTIKTLRDNHFVPMDAFFGMTTASVSYQMDREGYFNAQAWSFVHLLLLGDNGANRPALKRFIEKWEAGFSEQKTAAFAFPEGNAAVEQRLRRYITKESYRSAALDQPVLELKKRVTVSQPSSAETNAILGLLSLRLRDVDEARPYFKKAEASAPTSPLTLEVLAENALVEGNLPQAREYFSKAAAAGSTYYLSTFYPAMDRAYALYGGEYVAGKYDATMVREVVDSIKKTIRQRPTFLSARNLFSGLIGALSEVNDDDRSLLAENLLLYSNAPVVQAGQAAYEIKANQLVEAKARLRSLQSGEFDSPEFPVQYVKNLERRLGARLDLQSAGINYDQGKLTEARISLDRLRGAPLLPSERTEYDWLLNSISAEETFVSVREAIAKNDFDLARTWLSDIKPDELRPKSSANWAQLKAALPAVKK